MGVPALKLCNGARICGLWIISFRERSWSVTERNVCIKSRYKALGEEGRRMGE